MTAALCMLLAGVDLSTIADDERTGDEGIENDILEGDEGERMNEGWTCRIPSGGGVQVTMVVDGLRGMKLGGS